MKRIGTVLVFKKGATKEEVTNALLMIESVLDQDTLGSKSDDGPAELKVRIKDRIHEFDDGYGGPVWYIP